MLTAPEQIERALRERGFRTSRERMPSGRVDTDATHSVDEVLVLLDGSIEIDIGGVMRCPQPGEEVVLPAGTLHTIDNTGDRPATVIVARRG